MKKSILILLVAIGFSTGCTENQRAKSFGGTANVNLPASQKLVNVTWKKEQLWVLTKPMTTNDVAETYTFKEHSSFGLLEGTVVIVEKK
jgi:hypothetical protein